MAGIAAMAVTVMAYGGKRETIALTVDGIEKTNVAHSNRGANDWEIEEGPAADRDQIEHQQSFEWVQLWRYMAIEDFIVITGRHDKSAAITMTTHCDRRLIWEAVNVSRAFSGPLSVAVYMDQHYKSFDALSPTEKMALAQELKQPFEEESNEHGIRIALLYHDQPEAFWTERGIKMRNIGRTSMQWKIPQNVLRNLAERKVETEWVFHVDVDFWVFGDTFNLPRFRQGILQDMYDLADGAKSKAVFVVPAFEMNKTFATEKEVGSFTRDEIRQNRNIVQFHRNFDVGHYCTNYARWFGANSIYEVNISRCALWYEPWVIIKTAVSRMEDNQWPQEMVGRGWNKVARLNMLRHNCFRFWVLPDVFMVHSHDLSHSATRAHEVHASIDSNFVNKKVWNKKTASFAQKRDRVTIYQNSFVRFRIAS